MTGPTHRVHLQSQTIAYEQPDTHSSNANLSQKVDQLKNMQLDADLYQRIAGLKRGAVASANEDPHPLITLESESQKSGVTK